jgi:hypothetical protein
MRTRRYKGAPKQAVEISAKGKRVIEKEIAKKEGDRMQYHKRRYQGGRIWLVVLAVRRENDDVTLVVLAGRRENDDVTPV